MSPINRRGFLPLAGGATAMATLSPSIARAAAIPADRRTGTIADVDHIVVLMQENRSFDHYFGALRGVRGFGDRTPVTLPDGRSVWDQDGVLPFRPDADDLGLRFLQDLPHGWNDGHDAFNHGRYDRWVPAKSATTMAYLTRDDWTTYPERLEAAGVSWKICQDVGDGLDAAGAPAASSGPRSSTTPRSSGSSRSGSACASRTSRPGGARSAAT